MITRWLFIWSIIATYRLDTLLPSFGKKRWVRFLMWLTPASRSPEGNGQPYERVRLAIEELGPIFVKFGQALSTRPDLLAPELAKELSKLQDKVQPFPTEQAIDIIEQSSGMSLSSMFAEFDDSVLASASIAQVHTATLHSGENVVVKVVRPGIADVIKRDIQSLRLLAKTINWLVRDLQRLRLPELVDEFAHTLDKELDLRQEAANASQLRANFADSTNLYVPTIYWDFVNANMMVMERIQATQISDMQALSDANVNMEKLASRGVEIFFTQVFYHKYFHADMHPGNIFVDISNPEDPVYKAIDFGIMGTLSDEDQYYLAENFLAFFNRDYYRVAKLHIDSGWVPKHVSVHEFEAAIRKVGEPIFGKPLAEISFGEFLITLIQVARQFEMIIQPQLLLLQKTVLNVEGLGRVLYPQLDLWACAKPILENWMKDNFGAQAFIKQLRLNAPEYRELIPKLPQLLDQHIQDSHKQPTVVNNHLPQTLIMCTAVVMAILPDVWCADIVRPVAAISAVILGVSLWRSRN